MELTSIEVLVLVGGIGLMGLIGYYFFGPKEEFDSVNISKNKQIAKIIVDAAYIPSEIRLKVGIPTEIEFERKDRGDCTEWVIISMPTKEGQETKSRLPEGETTKVEFIPTEKGTFKFSCGMGMVHGKIIVS